MILLAILISIVTLTGCQFPTMGQLTSIPSELQAETQYREGNYQAAMQKWKRLLQTYEQENNQSEIARIYINLGTVYAQIGQYQAAFDALRRAIAIAREMQQTEIPTDKPGVSAAYTVDKGKSLESKGLLGLSSVYISLGQHRQALEPLQRSLALGKEHNNTKIQAKALTNIGSVYTAFGEYKKALDQFEEVLSILRTHKDKDSEGSLYANMGGLYLTLGRYDEAKQNLETSLAIVREVKHTSKEVKVLTGLGFLYRTQEQYQQAQYMYEQAIETARQKGLPTELTELLLADIIGLQGDLERAKQVYTRYDDKGSLGFVNLFQGDFHNASRHFQATIDKAQQNRNSFGLFLGYTGLGRSLEGLHKYQHAEESYRAAIEITNKMSAGLSVEQKSRFFSANLVGFSRLEPYEGLVRVLMQMGEYKAAFFYGEHTKGRLFTESIARRHGSLTFRLSKDIARKERTLVHELTALQERHDEAIFANNDDKATVIRDRIEVKQREQEALIAQIRKSYPEYAALWYPEPLKVAEIPLQNHEYLLAYEVTETHTITWLIHNRKVLKAENIVISRSNLENLINDYRESLYATRGSDLYNFNADAGHKLYAVLLKNMLKRVPARGHLIIVPDEILGLLPFEALITKRSKQLVMGESSYGPFPQNIHYVGDTHEISYSQSATSLAIQRKLYKRSKATKPMFIIADPIFMVSDPRVGAVASWAQLASNPLKPKAFDTMRAVESTGEFAFPRLQKTAQLANNLQRMFGRHVMMLEGPYATVTTLREKNLSDYRYIVFATHGILDSQVRGLNEPALVMSQVGKLTNDDGFLTMSEVMDLRLDAEISALVACDTGRGRRVRGEGVMGLGRAFQYAGSQSVLVSLWSVEVNATTQLTEHFFAYLQAGKTHQKALHSARRDIRKAGYEHPFYWSAFILISG